MKKEQLKIIRIMLQAVVFCGMIVLFLVIGFPIPAVIIFGLLMLLLILFRTKFYRKIDRLMRKHIHLLARFPEWAVKLIIIAVFILLYFLVKELIFEGLKLFGIDVEAMIMESINKSVRK